MEIKCERPVIILTHKFLELVTRGFDLITICGEHYKIQPFTFKKGITLSDICGFRLVLHYKRNDTFCDNPHLPATCNYEYYSKHKAYYYPVYSIPYDKVNHCYIVNTFTGEAESLFQIVKCNHCSTCLQNKVITWQKRVQLEQYIHKVNPFFVTLTYSDSYYPLNPYDMKFIVGTLQRFIKRLRKHLSSNGFKTDFKYLITSEYGSKRGRLHYHALFYGVDSRLFDLTTNLYSDAKDLPKIFKFSDFVRRSWSFGFSSIYEADGNAGSYVMKYIGKQTGKMLHSRYFGKEAIMSIVDYLRENPKEMSFKLNIDGEVKEFMVDNYVIQYAYPNVRQTLPREFRDLLCKNIEIERRITALLRNNLITLGLFNEYQLNTIFPKLKDKFYAKYSQIIHYLRFNEVQYIPYQQYYDLDIFSLVERYEKNLFQLSKFDYDFESVILLDKLYNEHMSVLTTNINTYDVPTMRDFSTKFFSDLYSRENDGQ